jgi:hypothetical protein
MSAPKLSTIVRFLLIAAGLIVLLSVLWIFVDSGYSAFLGKIASAVTSDQYRVTQQEGTIYFTQKYIWDTVNGHLVKVALPDNFPPRVDIVASAIQFGLLLTVSLVAATPALPWRRRLLSCFLAAFITVFLQILSVIITARTFNTLFFVVISDIVPPILWAIFSFRYWFKAAPSPAGASTGKPAASGPGSR